MVDMDMYFASQAGVEMPYSSCQKQEYKDDFEDSSETKSKKEN